MYLVLPSGKFDKSVERLRQGRNWNERRVREFLKLLASGESLPNICKDHQLKGGMSAYRECHTKGSSVNNSPTLRQTALSDYSRYSIAKSLVVPLVRLEIVLNRSARIRSALNVIRGTYFRTSPKHDLLLQYRRDETARVIVLANIGSHQDLFGD